MRLGPVLEVDTRGPVDMTSLTSRVQAALREAPAPLALTDLISLVLLGSGVRPIDIGEASPHSFDTRGHSERVRRRGVTSRPRASTHVPGRPARTVFSAAR